MKIFRLSLVVIMFCACAIGQANTFESLVMPGEVISGHKKVETECMEDSDCVKGGCSGTVCQPKNTPPVFTTCEWADEYACYRDISCSCNNGGCEWEKADTFDKCVEESRNNVMVFPE